MMVEAQDKVPCPGCGTTGYARANINPEDSTSWDERLCTGCNGTGFVDYEPNDDNAWHCLDGLNEAALKSLFKGKWRKDVSKTARLALRFLGCPGFVDVRGKCGKCGKQHKAEVEG